MKLWNQIKAWATASDEAKVAMDRRAFLKGMTVTGAGLLIPGATVFDLGRRPLHVIQSDFSGLEIRIEEFLHSPVGRFNLAQSMVQPIRMRRDWAAVGRETFIVESLPSGSLPIYGKEPLTRS